MSQDPTEAQFLKEEDLVTVECEDEELGKKQFIFKKKLKFNIFNICLEKYLKNMRFLLDSD